MPDIEMNNSIKELIEFLITDSIFCLHEIIVNSEQYGKSFLVNHSFMAKNHKKLMFWSELYYLYIFIFDIMKAKKDNKVKLIDEKIEKLRRDTVSKFKTHYNVSIKESFLKLIEKKISNPDILLDTDINKKLSRLIGRDNVPLINTSYQCEKAIKEYYSAVETHTEGNAYKNLIEEMYYLNDDFNDNTYHFSVAIERFMLNSKTLDLDLLKRKVKDSVIYKHESYLKTIIDSTSN